MSNDWLFPATAEPYAFVIPNKSLIVRKAKITLSNVHNWLVLNNVTPKYRLQPTFRHFSAPLVESTVIGAWIEGQSWCSFCWSWSWQSYWPAWWFTTTHISIQHQSKLQRFISSQTMARLGNSRWINRITFEWSKTWVLHYLELLLIPRTINSICPAAPDILTVIISIPHRTSTE